MSETQQKHRLASVLMAVVSRWQRSAAVPAAASIPPVSFYSAAALCVLQAVREHDLPLPDRLSAAAAAVEIDLRPSYIT